MKVKDITAAIEEFAPLSMQASFDNSGLMVGRYDTEVNGALLAVDLTEAVVEEAIKLGVNMIVTHHPIIFSPLKRLTGATYVERSVELAVKNDIVVYAAHTNLDSAPNGMSWRLGEMLQLTNMEVLELNDPSTGAGFGVVGELAAEMPTAEYVDFVANELQLKMVRHSDVVRDVVRRVAICTGSGGSMMSAVKRSGADVYITADLKYNDFFEAQQSVTVVDVGHYESEFCVIEIIFDILSKKMINFALHKSFCGANPVHYKVY